MAKENTLKTIEREIDDGKLGIARDRLHGLVVSYPDDLSLRSRLGDVYWKLGYPANAGLYWFFDDFHEGHKSGAVAKFVGDCSHDPSIVLKRLKLRCHPDQLPDDAAKERVQELIDECLKRRMNVPEFQQVVRRSRFQEILQSVTCLIAFLAIVVLLLIGINTVLHGFIN